jgi:hypothetical protein
MRFRTISDKQVIWKCNLSLYDTFGRDNAKWWHYIITRYYSSWSPGGAGRHEMLHRSRGCQGGGGRHEMLHRSRGCQGGLAATRCVIDTRDRRQCSVASSLLPNGWDNAISHYINQKAWIMRKCIISCGHRGRLAAVTRCCIDLVAARGGWPPRDCIIYWKTNAHEWWDNAISHYPNQKVEIIMRCSIIYAKHIR